MDVLRLYLKVILICSLTIFIVTFFLRDLKPDKDTILQDVQGPPIQKEITLPPFEVEKDNMVYTIYPQYNYEFIAVVVSYMNNESWISRFRESDPLNTKDLCIMYGSNALDGVYHNLKIYSEEFACKYQNKDGQTIQFNPTEMANNHLLPANEEVYQKIRNTRVGDQVHLKGYLVNYAAIKKDSGVLMSKRETSSIRDDEKCETIYVTGYEILKPANSEIKDIFTISGVGILGSFLALMLLGIITMERIPSEKEMQYIPEGYLTRDQVKAQIEAKIAQRKKLEARKKKK